MPAIFAADGYIEDDLLCPGMLGVNVENTHLHIGQRRGDIGQQFVSVNGVNLQMGFKHTVGIAGIKAIVPAGLYPTGCILRRSQAAANVGAILLVDGNAKSFGDEADDRSPGSGLQHLANLTRHPRSPSTIMPAIVFDIFGLDSGWYLFGLSNGHRLGLRADYPVEFIAQLGHKLGNR